MFKFAPHFSLIAALALTFGAAAAASAQGNKSSDGAAGAAGADVGQGSVKPNVVTSSFFRMHHPEVLIELAKQVSKGGARREDLDKLAGPNFALKLLGGNLGAFDSTGKKPGAGGASISFTKLLGLPPAMNPNDYTPKSIEYPTMIPGEEEQRGVQVTSPIDGAVSANVSSQPSVFQIEQMQSFTGEAFFGQGGTIMVPDQTSTNGTLPIKAGQQFLVMMKFSSPTEGTFTSTLNLRCESPNEGAWSVSIPLKIVVSRNNNYKAAYTGTNPIVVAFPGKPFTIQVPVKPINWRKQFSATVTCNCPPGITATPTKIQFNKNAPVTATIHCQCLPNAQIQEFALMGAIITADDNLSTLFWPMINITPYQIQISFGDINSWYHVSGFQTFGSVGSFDETWKNPSVVLDGDGHFTYLGTLRDNGQGATYPLSTFSGPGNPVPLGVFIRDYKGVNHGSYGQLSGVSGWVKANWDDISNGRLKSGAWFIVGQMRKYFDGNLPPVDKYGDFTLPLKTPVTVRRW